MNAIYERQGVNPRVSLAFSLATMSIIRWLGKLSQYVEEEKWLNMHFIGALGYNYNQSVYLFQVWI